MQDILTISAPDGKTYKMPWSEKRDPTEEEIKSFINSQSKIKDVSSATPFGREVDKSIKTGKPVGVKGMFESFLPDSWRFGKDLYKPEELPSYPVRAAQEVGNDLIRGFASPAGVITGLVGGGGSLFPNVRRGIANLSKKALPSLFGKEVVSSIPGMIDNITPQAVDSTALLKEVAPVDQLKNKEVVTQATGIKPKLRAVKADYSTVDVLNPSKAVADEMSRRGYSIMSVENGVVRMTRDVQPITPPVSGSIGVPSFGSRKPPNKPPVSDVVSEAPKPQPFRHPSMGDRVINVLSASKGFTTGPDLSAPLRQGRMLAHKSDFWKSFDDMFKGLKSEADYEAIQQSITSKPSYEFQQKSGLVLTDLGDDLAKREEATFSNIPEKISIGGIRPWRASNRAYNTFINKLRSDTFDSLVTSAQKVGKDPTKDPKLAQDIAEFINNATGRYKGGDTFEGAAKALNAVFFSPRFMMSRLYFLNPNNYRKVDPFVRKEMLKSVGSLVGSQAAILTLAGIGGAKITTDLTNSDFGKIRIRNTRIDTSAGFLPFVRTLYQVAPQWVKIPGSENAGHLTSSNTGKVYDLSNPKFNGPTRAGVAGRNLIVNKLTPLAAYTYYLMVGKNFEGEKFEKFKWDDRKGEMDALMNNEEAKVFIPMIAANFYELYKEDPSLLPLEILEVFGGSVQTYKPKTPNRSLGSFPK